jgi:putative DNA primase/helicase
VITQLLGEDNVRNPTMASMSTNFGLWPLIGKPLAIVSDARLGNTSANDPMVERLLSVSGEDRLTIDRKYGTHRTGKLPTRLMLLSNELPRFRDVSGVIANRFMILKMTKTWLHNEDKELANKLRPELPSILNWSLAGLDDLNDRGKFTVPQSSYDEMVLMQDMASPCGAFTREMCTLGPTAWCGRDSLYAAYRLWCDDNGHKAAEKIVFGRDLRAVVPTLKRSDRTINGFRVHGHAGIKLTGSK